MQVPFLDLAAEAADTRAAVDAAVRRVLDSHRFIGGPEVSGFEAELCAALDVRAAVGVSSGTDALLVSLMALGVGPGDEVVTTPYSFFATAGAVARLGARPVFADIEDDGCNLDPAAAAAAVTPRTRAVITVHLYGRPAALPDVAVPVIEDAAQAIGAAPVRGACATLSFFPSKNLGACGDAGAVITGDAALAARIALLRNHGAQPKYFHAVVGGNFRLDALQAAILRARLPRLRAWIAARRAAADRYRALFAAAAVPDELVVPADHPQHTYNQFVVRAPRRDALAAALAGAGVDTAVYYPLPFHLQACFADLGYRAGAFPRAERAAAETLALPIYPTLSEAAQSHVVDAIAAFYTSGARA